MAGAWSLWLMGEERGLSGGLPGLYGGIVAMAAGAGGSESVSSITRSIGIFPLRQLM